MIQVVRTVGALGVDIKPNKPIMAISGSSDLKLWNINEAELNSVDIKFRDICEGMNMEDKYAIQSLSYSDDGNFISIKKASRGNDCIVVLDTSNYRSVYSNSVENAKNPTLYNGKLIYSKSYSKDGKITHKIMGANLDSEKHIEIKSGLNALDIMKVSDKILTNKGSSIKIINNPYE